MRYHTDSPRLAVTATLLCVAVLTTASISLPQPRGSQHREALGPPLQVLGALLDLTPVQEEQIEDLRETTKPAVLDLFDQLRSARQALHDQIENEVFDEGAIRHAASVVAAVEADLAVQRALVATSVRDILTEEQLQQLELLREEHHQGHRTRGRFGGTEQGAGD